MVKLDPHERVPWKALITQLASEGKWDETIAVGESAIYVDVYSPDVHSAYAHALTMKGRTKEAHDEIDAGLAAKPKGPGEAMLRAELARVLWREKNAVKAKEALDAALKLDPKNTEALKLKGEIK
jgi:Flp pilus assembly protein TadD